jgi:hypothetical protein
MGVWSDLPTVVTKTTIKDTTTPAVPGAITLLLLSGVFSLKWAKPSTLDLRGGGYKVYVFTSDTPASAVLIREVGYTSDSTEIFIGEKSQDVSITITAGTTYWFWVTTLDASGNESAKVATTPVSGSVSVAGTGLDHGVLTGLADDDHTQYVKHSLATAVNDFLVASGVGVFIKKTLAEVQTLIGAGTTFLGLTDTPDTYVGAAGKFAKVNVGESALEFAALAGGGDVLGPATSVDNSIARFDGTDNKTIQGSPAILTDGGLITPRITTIASHATPTINTDDCDAVTITAQAEAITSMTTNLSGAPVNFQKLIIRIKDNGTLRAIAWGASFVAKGVALPTTTVATKLLTTGFIYDTVAATWGCVASVQEV